MNIFKTISSGITIDDFLDKWNEAEKYHSENGQPDGNSLRRIGEFRKKILDISCIEIEADKMLTSLIIPYHAGQDHYFKTSEGGNTLNEFLASYTYEHVRQNSLNKCSKSLQFHIDYFIKQKTKNHSFVKGTFMYCSKNVELSPDENGRAGNYLYAGSFHQFAAYGLYINRFGPIPLRLYLCNNAPSSA